MTQRILLVFGRPDWEWRDLIEQRLRDFSDQDAPAVEVDLASTAEEAKRRLRAEKYDSVVAGLSLSRNSRSTLDERGGLAFFESAPDKPFVHRMLVVPAHTDDIRERCARLSPPVTVEVVGDRLADHVAAFLHKRYEQRHWLNVVIYTRPGDHWPYELHMGNGSRHVAGTLKVKPYFVDMLKRLSRAVGEAGDDDWHGEFDLVGTSLVEHFCGSENPAFARDITQALRSTEQIENTRVSFVVEQNHYDIALEAMKLPPKGPVPWMVRAPLFRNLAGTVPMSPGVFGGRRARLRALVVCADVSGSVGPYSSGSEKGLAFGELDAVSRECSAIVKILEDLKEQGGDITVEKYPQPGRQRVERRGLLRYLEQEWDLVHIAGHATFDEKANRALLIVGGKDAPVELDIATIAPFLRKSRLLYLSSCESANAAFAAAVAKAGVPAVVGFRWEVDDRFAAMHARLFYRNLFKHHSVETAFYRTRRAIYNRFEQNQIWAASMLVMGER
jgi:hypothetical protein